MANYKIPTHRIDRRAIQVCKTLHQAGYQAFLVGGCVRDLLLGVPPKDWDIATDAIPARVECLFQKTIPTGIKHGTVTVVLEKEHFEVTTFRIEGSYQDGRRPEEVFFVMEVEQDLSRRDFTINAMAYDPINKVLHDPYLGSTDLENKMIKAVGNPNLRFQEDGLRIMRAARFAAKLSFSIDPDTSKAMKLNLPTLNLVSRERIREELSKILLSNNAKQGLFELQQCGATSLVGDLFSKIPNSMLFQVGNIKGSLETKLSYLYSRFSPSEIPEVQNELMRLKFSSKEIKMVMFNLQLLERFRDFFAKDTEKAYKSFMAVIVNHSPLSTIDTTMQFVELTQGLGYSSLDLFQKYVSVPVIPRKDLSINGNDLLALGFSGPKIKELLDAAYLKVLMDPSFNTKEKLLDLLK